MIFSKSVKYTVTVGLFIMVLSCQNNQNCEKVSLSKEEMEWFNMKDKDTIFYLSTNTIEKDTFLIDVSKAFNYTTCNKFELGPYIYQFHSFKFLSLDNYVISNSRRMLSILFDKTGQNPDNRNCSKNIRFFELDVDSFNDLKQVPQSKIKDPYSSDSIEVYRFKLHDNAKNYEGLVHIMAEFSISKKYGLMSYQRLDSVRFERVW